MMRVIELLKTLPHYQWAASYLLTGDELVLGVPGTAPSPHTRIPLGRASAAPPPPQNHDRVDEVTATEYLACSLETQSENRLPIVPETALCSAKSTSTANACGLRPADRRCFERNRALLAEKM